MNNLYWTECNLDFWNFLLQNGFSYNYLRIDNQIKAVRLNLDEKRISGWAIDKAKYYRPQYSEYKYISNEDLTKKLLTENDSTKNEFKVGDKVICIKGCADYHLKENVEYIITDVCEAIETVKLKGVAGGYWCQSRFILSNSNQTMSNKKIAIKVGNNQELSRIVQEFLFSKGFYWIKGEKDYENWPEQYGSKGCIIFESDSKSLYHGRAKDDFKIYDAATQFGEIIALFSEPPKPVIKIKNEAGQEYEADFQKNPGYVTFGCAKIDTKTFSVLNETLNTKVAPDSKSVEQIKIGRGIFTPADIKAIVEHPDFESV